MTETTSKMKTKRKSYSAKRRIMQILILVLAVCAIAFGVYRQELSLIINKAIQICLECIGIG